MYRRYDFECSQCKEVFEEWVDGPINEPVKPVPCKECGAEAHKTITPVRFALDGTDPAFPTEWDKWAKRREQKIKLEKKQSEE